MAEYKKEEKRYDNKKPKHHSSGEMNFGIEIIIFLVILFIIWAFLSKPSVDVDKPFIKAETVPTSPQ